MGREINRETRFGEPVPAFSGCMDRIKNSKICVHCSCGNETISPRTGLSNSYSAPADNISSLKATSLSPILTPQASPPPPTNRAVRVDTRLVVPGLLSYNQIP